MNRQTYLAVSTDWSKMAYLDFESAYEKAPETIVCGSHEAWSGWDEVLDGIGELANERDARVVTVDVYPGVRDDVLDRLRERLSPSLVIDMRELLPSQGDLDRMLAPFLTDDRVRGRMCYMTMKEFLDAEKLAEARARVEAAEGRVLVYGVGAALVAPGEVLVCADLARWEAQLRYRAGMPNYFLDNADEDMLRKVKCGFFVEWRVADRHKFDVLPHADLYLDTNGDVPAMTTVATLIDGLGQLTRAPFRLVPYFDPGVWGGQWMREVCKLPAEAPNYAWAFDGVPEENSVYLRFGGVRIESPAMNLTKLLPREFLGRKTFARWGAECPIRFDFLDTMGGQNLSLQVHPTTEYMHEHFGMAYTQDESYYILDAEPGGGVYLGLKEGVDADEMIEALRDAQSGDKPFDAERYVNLWPAKKHDHFLIPAGTVHCSSAGTMVLEVSATPYIFTFKLWDWGRLGMDGKPRPIHIDDGERVIAWERTTDWVRENLVNALAPVSEDEDCTVTHTGLHELESIETHAIDIRGTYHGNTNGELRVFNLVEGRSATVSSPTDAWEPREVHYAETVFVPASAGAFDVASADGSPIRILEATPRV